jgi:hypothetical protein
MMVVLVTADWVRYEHASHPVAETATAPTSRTVARRPNVPSFFLVAPSAPTKRQVVHVAELELAFSVGGLCEVPVSPVSLKMSGRWVAPYLTGGTVYGYDNVRAPDTDMFQALSALPAPG